MFETETIVELRNASACVILISRRSLLAARYSLVLTLVAALSLAGCNRSPAPAAQTIAVKPVPHPDIQSVDKNAREQIEAAMRQAEYILTTDKAGSRLLRARAFGELGKVYYAYQFADAATACFENARALEPSEYRWAYLLGHAYKLRGDDEQAAALLREATELMQLDMSVQREQGIAALLSLAEVHHGMNQPEQARKYLEQAAAEAPQHPAVLAEMGRLAAAEGDAAAAVEHFNLVLQAVPAARDIRLLLAAEYMKLGEVERAEQVQQEAEELPPQVVPRRDPLLAEVQTLNRSAAYFLRLGTSAMRAKRLPRAAAAFRTAVELEPESVAARNNLANVLVQLDKFEEAKTHLAVALEVDPKGSFSHANMGFICLAEGRLEEARQHFETALQANPVDAPLLYNLGASLSLQGRHQEALPHFERAVEADHRHGPARIARVRMLAALGRYREALEQAERCVADLPELAAAKQALARLLAAAPEDDLRDGSRAVEIASAEVAAGPGVRRFETLAMALAEAGRFDEAVKLQQSAIDRTTLIQDDASLPRLNKNLARYQEQKPCREPWDAAEHFPAVAARRTDSAD